MLLIGLAKGTGNREQGTGSSGSPLTPLSKGGREQRITGTGNRKTFGSFKKVNTLPFIYL
ncbi:hypothetical protein BJP37_12540 [Moorena bouillonii PNG]|uniref:Uncharacterized protein n=1 Tax=Moorena bouillonii PNG TaxID=568701 RepID=A0A1U7N187_9CYAN|nr:hypothetical protein BJP37_12540 [Moorena bouillonii PNG]